MPDDDLTFSALCEAVDLSANTVKARLRELKISPRRLLGSAKLFPASTVERVQKQHAAHGGRWPSKAIR